MPKILDSDIEIVQFDWTRDRIRLLEIFDSNTPPYFHPDEKSRFENYLKNEVEDYYILNWQSQTVGCGGINYEGKVAILSWDMIHYDFAGCGFGRILTEYRIHKIRNAEKYSHIRVRTAPLTEAFYIKLGFITVERKSDYWAKGIDMVRMINAL